MASAATASSHWPGLNYHILNLKRSHYSNGIVLENALELSFQVIWFYNDGVFSVYQIIILIYLAELIKGYYLSKFGE